MNNIIWGNKPDDVFTRDAVCDNIWYSILGRTNHESICDSDAISEEQGNLFADPLLADPEKGDLRLLPGSPAIDAGDPTGDLDPDGTRADIGALWFPQSPPFLRGDADEDGRLGLGDAILCLEHLFASKGLACEKAADVDDDGALTIGDVVRLLNFLFAGGEPPTAPYPDPGQDPTADELACTR